MGIVGSIAAIAGPLIGDVIGAGNSSDAISSASEAQQQAAQQMIAEQRRQYDTSRSDFLPFMNFGKTAIGPLGDLLGLNGSGAASSAIAALKNSPLYQSLFNNGQEAILQNASATGGLRGGNTQGALADFGRDTLAQVIQNQIGNLFGVAGVGEGSTSAISNVGMHTTDQIGQGLSSIGQAQAGAALGQAGVTNNLINQISALFSPSNLSKLFPGGI
jgi:hypothetical protein